MIRLRPLAATVALLTAVAAAGCGDPSSGDAAGVTIDIDLARGHAWTATGDQVADGTICPSGRHWWVEPRAIDETTPLTLDEFARRLAEAQASGSTAVDYTLLAELMCDDGSGTVTVIDRPGAASQVNVIDDGDADAGDADDGDADAGGEIAWFVVSGTGAYADLVGEGTAVLVLSGPPSDPTDPDEGEPSVLRWTGSFEHAGPDATR